MGYLDVSIMVRESTLKKIKILFVVNIDSFFVSHRLPIALEALNKGYEVHVAAKFTDKMEMLSKLGLIVHPINFNRSRIGILSLLMEFIQTIKILNNVKPDVAHLISIKPVILGGIASRIVQTSNIVSAISGLGFIFSSKGFLSILRRFIVKKLYKQAFSHPSQKIIFQNKDDRSVLLNSTGILDSKTLLIPGSGVDLEKFKSNPVSSEFPIIMLVARMLSDKGVREFVEASKILKSSNQLLFQQSRFVLVGDTDLSNPASLDEVELKSWAQSGIVETWGHIENMPRVLNNAHIVVLPSYREGFPKVLMEAAACGKPIITTDVPGCRDAIIPDVTGLLIPAVDATALANAIKSLLNDLPRCLSMGIEGRKFAEQQFDITQVISSHMSIYEELINK